MALPCALTARSSSSDDVRKVTLVQAQWRRLRQRRRWLRLRKMMAKRTQVAHEMLSTERQYVGALKTLVSAYLVPLRQVRRRGAIHAMRTYAQSFDDSQSRMHRHTVCCASIRTLRQPSRSSRKKTSRPCSPTLRSLSATTVRAASDATGVCPSRVVAAVWRTRRIATGIFLGDLDKRLATWSHRTRLGDVFLKMASFLKTYTQCAARTHASIQCS